MAKVMLPCFIQSHVMINCIKYEVPRTNSPCHIRNVMTSWKFNINCHWIHFQPPSKCLNNIKKIINLSTLPFKGERTLSFLFPLLHRKQHILERKQLSCFCCDPAEQKHLSLSFWKLIWIHYSSQVTFGLTVEKGLVSCLRQYKFPPWCRWEIKKFSLWTCLHIPFEMSCVFVLMVL